MTSEERSYWLLGIRLDPNFDAPDFYAILRQEPAYWPILYEGQIICFRPASLSQRVLDLHLQRSGLPAAVVSQTPDAMLDFAQAFYLVSSGVTDDGAALLNAINTTFDFLEAARVAVPPIFKSSLRLVADRLTFSNDFTSALDLEGLDREEVMEALQWSLGALMSKTIFLPKGNLLESP